MNDLSGLSWDSSPSSSQAQPAANGANYATLHPTPPNVSRQNTPLSAPHSGRNTPLSASSGAVPRPPPTDSFSNLLPSKKPAQLTLQERQKQLIEERARQQAEQQKRHNEQFKLDDSKFWEGFGAGSGSSTPGANGKAGEKSPNLANTEDEDDILAAFTSSAPVDSSSHFPPPQQSSASRDTSRRREDSLPPKRMAEPPKNEKNVIDAAQSLDFIDDDDPFGLGQMAPPPTTSRPSARESPGTVAMDDDDVLGMLGKPVEEVSQARNATPSPLGEDAAPRHAGSDIYDKAIAEIMDMGFSVEKATEALGQTESGVDVQAAVGWLLNQAHQQSKSKSPANGTTPDPDVLSQDRNAWKSQKARPSRNDSRSPGTVERDVAQRATELSSTLFKSANSLWKTGQKRVQKAMAEFHQEGDVSQPRWMREGQPPRDVAQVENSVGQQPQATQQGLVTDEALLLDSDRAPQRPPGRNASRSNGNSDAPSGTTSQQRAPVKSTQTRDLPTRPASRPVERLSKQVVEEQSAQAYVSPARRKRPQPQPASAPPIQQAEPELDIFSSTPAVPSAGRPSQIQQPTVPVHKPRQSVPVRARVTPREIPSTSPSSLSQSTGHRLEGTAAFKRGDYASAHASYTAAIVPLPAKHPITIILYSNRALTNLKTGDPKAAIADAEEALGVIGPSRGEGEVISLGQGESDRPMKEFFGKALMRKAEALEHMEKWTEAAQAWREAVAAGVGGSVSIQGRNRCEKAAGTTPTSGNAAPERATATQSKKPALVKPKPRSAATDLAGTAGMESQAVSRLRAANAAANAASDEAFALNDSVEARLNSWKNGKEGNLRALLASLDTVLWDGAGWTKVSMGDLVLTNKCKIVYMKAIGKCHPDKIPPDASVEQRMISASVFATLNEAWDKFKRDNGL